MTTYTTITIDQINALRSEACAAGDDRMVDWCDIALADHEDSNSQGEPLIDPDGDVTARTVGRAICAHAINAAAANV